MKFMSLKDYSFFKSLSGWAIIILVLINANFGNNLGRWKKNEVINHDVTHYHAYFPATFIYKDWKFEFAKNLPSDFEGRIWLLNTPDGKPVLKMTMGLSILWLPFETLAHLYAKASHFKADGYSKPYSFAIFIAALFYLFLGLFFLRKILLTYFSETVTSITLVLLVAGTNLMHYVIWEPGMSHVYNFFLIVLLIYLTSQWTVKPLIFNSIAIGIVSGLIVLIRPVNIIVLLIPLLWGVGSTEDLKSRMAFLAKNLKFMAIAGLSAFIIFIPQLFYWKIATGHWLYYSYQDENFFFLNPHITDGLFSYRKGWFVYTPVMFMAFWGFFFLKDFAKKITLSLSVTIVIAIYVVYSWWAWWYGGSYGSRPMIDFYALMALPLAAIIAKALNSNLVVKGLTMVLVVFLIWFNQFQMTQYRSSLLHWDSMTKKVYWSILFKKNWPEGYDKMLQAPNDEKAKKGIDEY